MWHVFRIPCDSLLRWPLGPLACSLAALCAVLFVHPLWLWSMVQVDNGRAQAEEKEQKATEEAEEKAPARAVVR